jgi:hypothetical protein
MRLVAASHQRSQLEDFLFAPIGDEKNGTTLTVLSALARQDIDPWREAASLAEMPRESATLRMSSLIADLPGRPSSRLDPEAIAAGLVARLPRSVVAAPARTKALPRASGVNYSGLFIFLALAAFLLGARIVIAIRELPTSADSAHASMSSTPSPPISTPSPPIATSPQ